jgi:hypothetical protein
MFGARLAAGLLLLVPGWIAIWTTTGYLNPIAFALLWTGAALLMWSAARDYPGVRRHLALAALSIPLWWYFEVVNGRTANWEYIGRDRYDDFAYAVFASISFATVVPALVAATAMIGRYTRELSEHVSSPDRRDGFSRLAVLLIGSGVASEAATLIAPNVFYPLVWIAPFLLFDGVVIIAGGRSIVVELSRGIWRRAAVIAGAGLLCGGLWEFWNFWAFPKWTYDIPGLDFVPVFEMPILGYGGYIPFAWSVLQLVVLVDIAAKKIQRRTSTM